MSEEKINIVRSYSRKISLGNYEMMDLFASRSMELPADSPLPRQQQVSEELFALAVADVEKGVAELVPAKEEDKLDYEKIIAIVDKVSMGNPVGVEEFQDLNEIEEKLVQSVKRAYKRSPMYKETLKPSERGK